MLTRRPDRERAALPWLSLVAALGPIVVAVVRSWSRGTIMLGDAAYFVTRSRDVLTEHHPLVGALSAGSAATNVSVNNLGPLHFDLLAPFTKLDAYWGAVLGAGAINVAAVVGVWFTARRMFGVSGVVGAMLATLALEATIGGALLVDTRQQVAMLLPFWCLLWLVAALSTGALWALPWTAFVASLLVQTHLSYTYQTALLLVCGIVGAVLAARGQPDETARRRRSYLITAGVVVVCWAQPLWDQFFGTGNLREVLGASDSHGLGVRAGTRIVADSVLLPPFWAPGGIRHFLRPDDGSTRLDVSTAAALIAICAWVVGLAAVVLIARRRHDRAAASIGVVSLVALASALLAATQLPDHPRFGLLPQNYYWMWPVGVFATAAVVAGGLVALRHRVAVPGPSPAIVFTAAAVLVLTAIPAMRASEYWPQSKFGQDMARELRRELRATLTALDGPVVLTFQWGVDDDEFNYMMLSELQREGIDFVFPAGNPNLHRFGRDRCMTGSERYEIRVVNGVQFSQRSSGDTVLADVDVLPPDDADDLDALDARFGEALRDGAVRIDRGTASYFDLEIPARVTEVAQRADTPATGLSRPLHDLARWGAVKVDQAMTADFDRWAELDAAARASRLVFELSPNSLPVATSTCT